MSRSNGSTRRPREGRRALFSDPSEPVGTGPAGEEVASGRRALFSSTEPLPVQVPTAVRGGVVVHCRTCLAATPMSLPALGLALVPSIWVPARPWPRLMRCPACRRLSWCRIEWPAIRPAARREPAR